ncbi:MAG: hypothetical protein QXV60_03320, partial [Nitrososphaerota archaeon]
MDLIIANKIIEILEEAKEIASNISDVSNREKILEEITENRFNIYFEIKDFEKAREVINEIKDPYKHFLALLRIAEASKDISDIEKARKSISNIEDVYYQARAFIALAEVTHDINDIKESKKARDIARRIKEYSYRVDILGDIIDVCIKAKNFELAREIMNEVESESSYPPAYELMRIAEATKDINDIEKAWRIVREIKDSSTQAI